MTASARRPAVFGIGCPWSGDDNDPRPRTYAVWVQVYWAVRRLRHRVGVHDWRVRPVDPTRRYCDWCGAHR